MKNEDNVVTGIVTDCFNGYVFINVNTQCSSCTSSCMIAGKSKIIKIKTSKEYLKGQSVTLKENTKEIFKASLLVYALPLVIMLIVAGISEFLFKNNIVTAVFTGFSLIISWVLLKFLVAPKIKNKPFKIID